MGFGLITRTPMNGHRARFLRMMELPVTASCPHMIPAVSLDQPQGVPNLRQKWVPFAAWLIWRLQFEHRPVSQAGGDGSILGGVAEWTKAPVLKTGIRL